MNETKSWFLEKINKIDKPLARLIRKRGPNKIREKKEVAVCTREIQRIIRDYYKQIS